MAACAPTGGSAAARPQAPPASGRCDGRPAHCPPVSGSVTGKPLPPRSAAEPERQSPACPSNAYRASPVPCPEQRDYRQTHAWQLPLTYPPSDPRRAGDPRGTGVHGLVRPPMPHRHGSDRGGRMPNSALSPCALVSPCSCRTTRLWADARCRTQRFASPVSAASRRHAAAVPTDDTQLVNRRPSNGGRHRSAPGGSDLRHRRCALCRLCPHVRVLRRFCCRRVANILAPPASRSTTLHPYRTNARPASSITSRCANQSPAIACRGTRVPQVSLDCAA